MEVLVVFVAIGSVLWFVFSDPQNNDEKKRKTYPFWLVASMILLIVIPPILMGLIILWNNNTVLTTFTELDLDLYILRLTIPFEIVALVTVALTVIFYGYALTTRESRIYYIGIPLQAVSLFIVFSMMSVLPDLEIFSEIEVEETSYLLVQVAPPESGELYLFACDVDENCTGEEIAVVEGRAYETGEMLYDAPTNMLNIVATAEEIEQYTVPLSAVDDEP